MSNIDDMEKLTQRIKGKIWYSSSFDAKTQNQLSNRDAREIIEKMINKMSMSDFLDIMISLGYKTQIEDFIVTLHNSNDGKKKEWTFKGTYKEAQDYVSNELIGKKYARYWIHSDNEYSHTYRNGETDTFTIENIDDGDDE